MTSVYIVSPVKPLSVSASSTALPTLPTPDWIGPGSSGSRPSSISFFRNDAIFSAMRFVTGVTGLKLAGLSALSVMTMPAIFSGGHGMKGVPILSVGWRIPIGLAFGGRPTSKISCMPDMPVGTV